MNRSQQLAQMHARTPPAIESANQEFLTSLLQEHTQEEYDAALAKYQAAIRTAKGTIDYAAGTDLDL